MFLVHAAVIAVNEAIDKGQATVTLAALKNPNAMLRNIQDAISQDYQVALSRAKARKQHQSLGRVRSCLLSLLCGCSHKTANLHIKKSSLGTRNYIKSADESKENNELLGVLIWFSAVLQFS